VLSPAVVRNTQFTMTWLRPGYEPRQVDAFLYQVGARMDRLIRENDEIRARFTGIRPGGAGLEVLAPPIPAPSGPARHPGLLTPVDVRFAQFALTRPGYEPMEVDAFLDRVEAVLHRLIRENDEIRARLGAARAPDAGRLARYQAG
jgi:DivIVA domain-containing protein